MTRTGLPSLVLASGSAGRLRLLRGAGFDPDVVVSGVDETVEGEVSTAGLVGLLAERKASAVAPRCPDSLVLGCDSMLDFEGRTFGKPTSAEHAARMFLRLSGRTGTLFTGHHLIDTAHGRQVHEVAATTVRFGTPTPAEIAAYVATGEPMGMAGGFSIDGLAGPFVDGIDGDPGNVIGLSLPVLRRLLANLGVTITDLWRTPAPGT